jgi:hypothetical protein
MFRLGTKKYRNPHSVRLCGFFVVRESPRESPEASSFSTIISTTGAVVLNSVVLRGNMDKKTRETGTNRLTDTKVKTAKAETKESTLLDGEGLELRVKPNGGKCSPPPKMKKTCGENEKLPARLFIKLDGTGITEFDNPVKPALNLYLVGR